MALIDNIIAKFRVTVSRSSGSPLGGAYVRVLSGTGEDVTTKITGISPAQTSSNGEYVATVLKVGPLPAGQYSIQVSAAGFIPSTQLTDVNFTGGGSFTFVLQPHEAGEYKLNLPEQLYVSALQPTEISVQAPDGSLGDWQLLQASITRDDSVVAPIDSLVPPDGLARLGISSRLLLRPSLFLVPDAITTIIDDDLFRSFTVTLAVVNDNVTIDLNNDETFSLVAGNVQPTGDTNDVSAYTSQHGLAKWLTPFSEMPVWAGYYADCSVVLHEAGDDYRLHTQYLYASRSELGDPVLSDFFSAPGKKAVKVRIPDAADGAIYAQLTILKNSEAVTQPLTVKYV